jgi:hypothetical protein
MSEDGQLYSAPAGVAGASRQAGGYVTTSAEGRFPPSARPQQPYAYLGAMPRRHDKRRRWPVGFWNPFNIW